MDYETLRTEIIARLEPDDLVDILGLNIEELVDLLALQIENQEDAFYFLDFGEEEDDAE